ncbi:MAG: cellulase family glycosylhydrolase, partial [Opitutaceae bacterium]
DSPRKGANCFNAEPGIQWFQAARELGVEWVRLAYEKWDGEKRDFLMGDADGFTSLVTEDLNSLFRVLDWAQQHEIKVVITPLGLPGNRWFQNNHDRDDLRLWNDKAYWEQAVRFWEELARNLRNHPAVYAYNLINEPTPEKGTDLAEHGAASRYERWYADYQGTSHDLPAFYDTVIKAIRRVDPMTPIMLDAGWYAQPAAFTFWPKMDDPRILYSFHLYEPYDFTSASNFREKRNLSYPGMIPFAGEEMAWDSNQIEAYLQPFFAWAQDRKIANNRLVCGEFGCYRRNVGCDRYLADVISALNKREVHWAFYSFREDEWDGYDYEIGVNGLGWEYWKAKEEGLNPPRPRNNNPLFEVIKKEFRK